MFIYIQNLTLNLIEALKISIYAIKANQTQQLTFSNFTFFQRLFQKLEDPENQCFIMILVITPESHFLVDEFLRHEFGCIYGGRPIVICPKKNHLVAPG